MNVDLKVEKHLTSQPWFLSSYNESQYTELERKIIDSYWTKELFERRLKEVNEGKELNIRSGDCQVHDIQAINQKLRR